MFKRQFNDDGELEFTDHFLYVKLLACRTKQPSVISFKHRFKDHNGMALIPDINMPRPISTTNDIEMIKSRVNSDGAKTRGARKIV